MKRYYLNNFLYLIISSFFLYFLNIAISVLPYITNSTESFSFFLILIFVICAIFVVFTLVRKNPKIQIVIFRGLICFCSYICVSVINAYIGTLYIVYDVMNIDVSVERNNGTGVLILTYIIFLIVMIIVTTLIFTIVKKVRTEFNLKKN